MAFPTKDGKKSFTNRSMAKNYDRRQPDELEKDDNPGEESEEEFGDEASDGTQMAHEHGPAHEVHIMHDHEGGKHHVHAMHPDGHEHHTEHGSADEAHQYAKDCAGAM